MIKINCPVKLCKSTNTVYSYKFKNLKYFKCNECTTYFQNPLPQNLDYKNKYNKEYFESYQKLSTKTSKLKQLRSKQYKHDIKILKKFYKDAVNKKVLDYGCGPGLFLKSLKSKLYGYELNDGAIVNKKITRLKYEDIKKHKFDLITLRGVIEHIPDFLDKVKYLTSTLKKNSFLFITATPNTLNLNFELNKSAFNQNHWGHIYHFNHINLSKFFLNFGLYNIHTSFDYSETVYANFLKDYKKQKQLVSKMKKNNINCNPGVGNMMTICFQKMV